MLAPGRLFNATPKTAELRHTSILQGPLQHRSPQLQAVHPQPLLHRLFQPAVAANPRWCVTSRAAGTPPTQVSTCRPFHRLPLPTDCVFQCPSTPVPLRRLRCVRRARRCRRRRDRRRRREPAVLPPHAGVRARQVGGEAIEPARQLGRRRGRHVAGRAVPAGACTAACPPQRFMSNEHGDHNLRQQRYIAEFELNLRWQCLCPNVHGPLNLQTPSLECAHCAHRAKVGGRCSN